MQQDQFPIIQFVCLFPLIFLRALQLLTLDLGLIN